jgi:hypothetical protein
MCEGKRTKHDFFVRYMCKEGGAIRIVGCVPTIHCMLQPPAAMQIDGIVLYRATPRVSSLGLFSMVLK